MKDYLLELLAAAESNMVKYESSGDERAIRAGERMIAELKSLIEAEG